MEFALSISIATKLAASKLRLLFTVSAPTVATAAPGFNVAPDRIDSGPLKAPLPPNVPGVVLKFPVDEL